MKPALKYAFAAVVLLLSFAAPVAAGPLEDATAADDRGDYATALLLLRELADQGNARAQFKLGGMYDDGRGVAQNDAGVTKVEFIKRLSSLRPMKHQLGNGGVVFAGEAVACKRKFLQGIAFSKMCKNSGCSSAQL